MFQHPNLKLAPLPVFFRRVLLSMSLAAVVILLMLGVGVGGYHWLARLPWVDSLLNASMILGGMGPVDPLPTPAAKVFASVYALVSGLIFVGAVGLAISPVLHRLLHKFHIDDADLQTPEEDKTWPPAQG